MRPVRLHAPDAPAPKVFILQLFVLATSFSQQGSFFDHKQENASEALWKNKQI